MDKCTKYIYDFYHKKNMEFMTGEYHDGMRRCGNKAYKDGLCKIHYTQTKEKEKAKLEVKK